MEPLRYVNMRRTSPRGCGGNIFSGRIPGFEANHDHGLHSRFVSLAAVANVAYGAAYLVDIFAQMSGFRELWRSARWIFVWGRS
jgi:hypothetical protein